MFPIEFFWRAASLHRDRIALISDDETLTFGQLATRVRTAAAGISAHAPAYQARVGVGGANSVNHLVALLATIAAGKVWVPLNPRNGTPELQRLIEFTTPSLLMLDDALSERLGDQSCDVIGLDADQRDSMQAWTKAHQGAPTPTYQGDLGDVQAIKFTGGTTGAPKGVMQTYRAWNTTIVTQWHEFAFDEHARFLVSAPLTHGASTYVLPILGAGGALVFPNELKPGAILDCIASQRITTLFMPPTLIYAVVHEMETHPRDTSSLRQLIYGAAPMPPQKIRDVQRVFGDVLATTYGQTEAPQVIACLRPSDLANPANMASVGKPSMMTDVRIMSKDGRLLPQGEEGEVVVRGDLVMAGYWQAPEQTRATLRDGWLHTGDLGKLDERGFLFLKDRLRDVIITGGFNVYPLDVEEAINRHPAVFDCAVFGVDDEKWGEMVHAAVVLREGMWADEHELTTFVKAAIGSVKAPKAVHFMASLPKSAVEKTLKSELRKAVVAARQT